MRRPSPRAVGRAFEVARLVGHARRVLRLRIARRLGRDAQSILDWQVVANLQWQGPMHQGELAEHIGHHPAGLSRLLADLGRRGLVRRAGDAEDRRRRSVSLTAKGRRWYLQWAPVVMEEVHAVMGRLSEAEQGELATLLAKLTGVG